MGFVIIFLAAVAYVVAAIKLCKHDDEVSESRETSTKKEINSLHEKKYITRRHDNCPLEILQNCDVRGM